MKLLLNKIKKEIVSRILLIGKQPLCNKKIERTPIIGKFVFILCYRCTGMIIGFIIGLLVLKILTTNVFEDYKYILIIFMLPMAIDGGIQLFFKIESNNFRRITTGIIFGFATAFL